MGHLACCGPRAGLTDGSGSVTDTYAHDAFGAVKEHDLGTSVNQWLFTGELQDSRVARGLQGPALCF